MIARYFTESLAWTELDTWIVVTGMLAAMACALIGNFLVLRRLGMMGDAISHAVLPGLAIAFLVTGSRDSLPMFAGAMVIGVVTAALTQAVHRLGKLEESASMGVVFTSLFAVGLVLIARTADHVDLDPSCVLYGAIELTPLDTTTIWGFELPRAALTNGIALLVNATLVLLLWKEFRISAFDPAISSTMGIPAGLMHYLLMTLTAATCVAAFESVGSILVIAMLIVPAATAHLLTDRLSIMVLLSLVLAAAAAFLGHVGAIAIPAAFGRPSTSTAGMIAVAAGVLFTLAFLLAPRHGLVSRRLFREVLSLRIAREDALGFLYRRRESAPGEMTTRTEVWRAVGEGWRARLALALLRWQGMTMDVAGSLRLTDSGVDAGAKLIRSHRLWESYLVESAGRDSGHVHPAAEKLEHFTSEELRQRLDEKVGTPSKDPHRRAIPR